MASWLRCKPTFQPVPRSSSISIFEELGQITDALACSEAEKLACHTAIDLLQKTFTTIPNRPLTWDVIFAWPLIVPNDFIQLIEERHPMALIILKQWCTPIFHGEEEWFLRGWAEQINQSVKKKVGERLPWAFSGSPRQMAPNDATPLKETSSTLPSVLSEVFLASRSNLEETEEDELSMEGTPTPQWLKCSMTDHYYHSSPD
ncbi:hypothetical protein F5884DRAFT_886841 [Xylogone sp. PMI_703]|nr:hypothetical protein F5884DRAFT_886841 [Xylogone sp. PMI_703]